MKAKVIRALTVSRDHKVMVNHKVMVKIRGQVGLTPKLQT
jgi:hypothetical protein